MQETKNITAGIDIKLNMSASLYPVIQGFINMIQGKTDPNNTFKLHFDNIYETMELAVRENIIHREQLTNNGSQASTKEKQLQI